MKETFKFLKENTQVNFVAQILYIKNADSKIYDYEGNVIATYNF